MLNRCPIEFSDYHFYCEFFGLIIPKLHFPTIFDIGLTCAVIKGIEMTTNHSLREEGSAVEKKTSASSAVGVFHRICFKRGLLCPVLCPSWVLQYWWRPPLHQCPHILLHLLHLLIPPSCPLQFFHTTKDLKTCSERIARDCTGCPVSLSEFFLTITLS